VDGEGARVTHAVIGVANAEHFPLGGALLARLRQSLFDRPSEPQASPDSRVGNTEFARPRDKWLRSSLMGQLVIAAPILLLFTPRRPTHVARFVMAVVVNAIQRVRWSWTWANVLVERGEAAAPPLAHRYPAPAVITIRLGVWVVTAGTSIVPNRMLGTSGTAVPVVESGRALAIQAAATLHRPAAQVSAEHANVNAAAIAPTPPAAETNVALYNESIEPLSSQIRIAQHAPIIRAAATEITTDLKSWH
jgi:hypothetical protein